MKTLELRAMSDAELSKRVQEAEDNLAHLRFQKVISQLENPTKIMLTRRDIARMKTILHQRKVAPVAPAAKKYEVKAEKV